MYVCVEIVELFYGNWLYGENVYRIKFHNIYSEHNHQFKSTIKHIVRRISDREEDQKAGKYSREVVLQKYSFCSCECC